MNATQHGVWAEDIAIPADTLRLAGLLTLPAAARGIVLFAHGSGSSRFSPRNRQVAAALNAGGYATLLFDLLSEDEHRRDATTGAYRFDIPLLAGRLMHAVDFVAGNHRLAALPQGLFGASTGAAAALIAAAQRPVQVRAVVSRGGRPDLAGDALGEVDSPVMLIVGGRDAGVIDLNRRAAVQLNVVHRTVIVPDASHLFEEPGKIEEVERLALEWFDQWLRQ